MADKNGKGRPWIAGFFAGLIGGAVAAVGVEVANSKIPEDSKLRFWNKKEDEKKPPKKEK